MEDNKNRLLEINKSIIDRDYAKCKFMHIKYFEDSFPGFEVSLNNLKSKYIKKAADLITSEFGESLIIDQNIYFSTKPSDDDAIVGVEISDTPIETSEIEISTETIYMNKKHEVIYKINGEDIEIIKSRPFNDAFVEKLKKIQLESNLSTLGNSVNLLAYNQHRGMYLDSIKMDEKFEHLDIDGNYNDDFAIVYDTLLENLKSDKTGLYLLHGEHGTGKTTLIRHLITMVNKKIIFIPNNLIDTLADPSNTEFYKKHRGSILIFEDSENILKSREGGGNPGVSNILNLSDGILGNFFKNQIICTFNTDINDVDEALLRNGRLICEYEFGKLEAKKADKILSSLGKKPRGEDIKLADIYNDDNGISQRTRKKIGFNK